MYSVYFANCHVTLIILQKPGRNIEMLKHMKSLAETQDVSPAGCCGYITFDEMSIQVIIQYRTLNTNRKIHQAIILFIENWQALHAQVKCLVFM